MPLLCFPGEMSFKIADTVYVAQTLLHDGDFIRNMYLILMTTTDKDGVFRNCSKLQTLLELLAILSFMNLNDEPRVKSYSGSVVTVV